METILTKMNNSLSSLKQNVHEANEIIKSCNDKINNSSFFKNKVFQSKEVMISTVIKDDIKTVTTLRTITEIQMNTIMDYVVLVKHTENNNDRVVIYKKFKKEFGFDIFDIVLIGKIHDDKNHGNITKLIPKQLVDFNKFNEKYSYKCFCGLNDEGNFKSRNHIIHEDVMSAYKCLSSILINYEFGVIYKQYTKI